jgi:hypothetical protein
LKENLPVNLRVIQFTRGGQGAVFSFIVVIPASFLQKP